MADLRIPWIRPELVRPSPYRWQERVPADAVGRFDLNTLPRDPAWWPAIAAEIATQSASSYPEADYAELKEAIAGYVGLTPAHVVPTAGGDEAILLTSWIALTRGDRAVVPRPTYQLHATGAAMTGAVVDAVPPVTEADLRFDVDAIVRKAADARLVWLCSPNNPTGEDVPADVVRAICAACPGLVAVDQAYLEFGDAADHLPLLGECPNLVIIRTFSKGWGLGALRAGYALANPDVAGALDALRPPGSLSTGSALGAELACRHVDEMRRDAEAYRLERIRLGEGLRAIGLDVVGEAGNFVLARTPWEGDRAFDELCTRGLVVRTFGHDPLLSGCIRACVSVPDENDLLVAALADMLAGA